MGNNGKSQGNWDSYEEYMQSDTWAKLAKEAREHANGRCQLCGEQNSTLEVHHNKYPTTWGEETQKDLIALCEHCHTAFHNFAEDKETAQRLKELLRGLESCLTKEQNHLGCALWLSINLDPSASEHRIERRTTAISEILRSVRNALDMDTIMESAHWEARLEKMIEENE